MCLLCKSLARDQSIPNNVMKITVKTFWSSSPRGERTEVRAKLQRESARRLYERREELHAVPSSAENYQDGHNITA